MAGDSRHWAKIELCGVVIGASRPVSDPYGKRLCPVDIRVGGDTFIVVGADGMAERIGALSKGQQVRIRGDFRVYYYHRGHKRTVITHVDAKEVEVLDAEPTQV